MSIKHQIIAIPAFSDNYIWAIINPENKHVALVDPGNANVCIQYIEQHQLTLCAILITHHHNDHVGGVDKLKCYADKHKFPLVIYGPEFTSVAHAKKLSIPKKHKKHTDIIVDEYNKHNTITLTSLDLSLKVMSLAGHTLEHVAYYNDDLIFCGDTLFSGGCGRIFEGTAQQMLLALSKIASLPDNTKVYCAHEYTQSNLHFAKAVEPNNKSLSLYIDQVNTLRKNNQSTIPTTIQLEKSINPFLRSAHDEVIHSALAFDKSLKNKEIVNDLDVFTAIREWKNIF